MAPPSQHPDDDVDRRTRFAALAGEVYLPLLRYLRRRLPPGADPGTAEDVLGDVLLVLWRRVDDIPGDAPVAWCYGVARGCLANAQRAAGRQRRLLARLRREAPAEQWSVATPDPAPDGLDDPALQHAYAALSPADREVLRLWAWEQLPPREIAVAMGITANAASVRLHRATQRLRQQLASPTPAGGGSGGSSRGKSPAAPGQVDGCQEKEAPR